MGFLMCARTYECAECWTLIFISWLIWDVFLVFYVTDWYRGFSNIGVFWAYRLFSWDLLDSLLLFIGSFWSFIAYLHPLLIILIIYIFYHIYLHLFIHFLATHLNQHELDLNFLKTKTSNNIFNNNKKISTIVNFLH